MSQADPSTRRRRSYHSPKREAAARATRRQIRLAAESLFAADGYSRTSMQAIAEAAGVAPRTVFLAFPSKAALLMEIIQAAVRGDDELALAARRAWQQMLELEPAPMLRRFAELSTDLVVRAARWLALGDAAADGDAEVAALGVEGRRRMRSDVTGVVRALAEKGALAPDVTEADAIDTLTALASHVVYLRLTADRRWSRKRYTDWLSRLLIRALLDHDAGA